MRSFSLATVIIAVCLCSTNLFASEVEFQSLSIDQALILADQNDKNIFVSYGAEWCLPCQIMEESILSDKNVIAILNHDFISVKADFDDAKNQEWFGNYGVSCLPTMSIVNDEAKEIDKIEGTMSISEFMSFLQKNNKRKRVIAASYQPIQDKVQTIKVEYVKLPSGATTTKESYESQKHILTKRSSIVVNQENLVVEKPLHEVEKTSKSIVSKAAHSNQLTKLTIVQFGAFSNYTNATKLKEKLESILDVPLIIHEDDKSLYKVMHADQITALGLANMSNKAKENGLDFYVKN